MMRVIALALALWATAAHGAVVLINPFITRGDIQITDDGDSAPSSGTGTSSHAYNSKTSTGPVTVVVVSWIDNSGGVSVSSITNATILRQTGSNETGDDVGVAIAIYDGAYSSSTITVTFSTSVNDSHMTLLSLSNVQSTTAVSSAAGSDNNGNVPLAPTTPGAGGVRIFAGAIDDTDAMEFETATELSNVSGGSHRHAVAQTSGDSGSTVSVIGGVSDNIAAAGVSLR